MHVERHITSLMFILLTGFMLGAPGVAWAGEKDECEEDEEAWVVQATPTANLATGAHHGLQIAGMTNVIEGKATSFQVSGSTNIVLGDLCGAQIATTTNITNGRLHGAQLGMVNISSAVSGGAMLGAINVVEDDTRGLQLGVINVSGEDVKGLQVGVINVASTSTASVGFLNLFWRGETMMDVSTSELGQLNAGVRHGSGAAFNTYFAGFTPGVGGERRTASLGLGRGWRFGVAPKTQVEVDLAMQMFFNADSGFRRGGVSQLQTLRLLTEWRASENFSVYAGPSLNVFHSPTEGANDYMRISSPWMLREGTEEQRAIAMWAGLTVGVRLF